MKTPFGISFFVLPAIFYGLSAPLELHLWKQLREESLNRLAQAVEDSLDMEAIFGWVCLPYTKPATEDHNPLQNRCGTMKARGVLASAYLFDWIAGDPEWFPHPVRLIGKGVEQGERLPAKGWPKAPRLSLRLAQR